jgi:hypothetical protein
MTGLIVAAFGVCAVALVALGYTVVSLRTEVDSMSRRFDALSVTGRGGADLSASTALDADGPPTLEPVTVAETADEPPVLITDMAHMADERFDTDPTVSRVVSVTLAGPLIKVAAFSHGVQRALREESRMRIAYAFRRELKQQRRMRRRQSVRRAASPGSRP